MSSQPGVAVFGAGAFGRNHLRVYREIEKSEGMVRVAAAVDPDPAARALIQMESPAATPGGLGIFASAEECFAARRAGEVSFDTVSVCAPTSAHYALTSAALAEGLDVLVEKPLAATLDEANDLVEQAARSGRILEVGHLERFNPAVSATLPLLNDPMFFEAHRLSVFTPRALDVDVVLDLMIHDLDIVLRFVRSPVCQVHAVGLPILSPKVDIANVRLEFASGATANLTASRVSTEKVRKLRFFQPHQYLSIDYARQDLLLIEVDPEIAKKAAEAGGQHSPLPSIPPLSFRRQEVQPGEPLRLEIADFLHSVRTRTPPRVSAEQGRDALALALEINREIERHAGRAGLNRFRTE